MLSMDTKTEREGAQPVPSLSRDRRVTVEVNF